MTREDLKAIFVEELTGIAPEIEGLKIQDSDNIQEKFDLDSMDIYNLLAALHLRLNIDIPDSDAPRLLTMNDALEYLLEQISE
jgi:acyl carrier protein